MKLAGKIELKRLSFFLFYFEVASLGLSVIHAEKSYENFVSEYEEFEHPEYDIYESEEFEEESLCKFRSLAERGSVFYAARSYNARDRANGQKIFDEILEQISRINEGMSLNYKN